MKVFEGQRTKESQQEGDALAVTIHPCIRRERTPEMKSGAEGERPRGKKLAESSVHPDALPLYRPPLYEEQAARCITMDTIVTFLVQAFELRKAL